ncbi:C6 zinc finger domain-containing protein [Colletotrichum tofieldiae]|nr:C6 zinc finger domain-containing protein [Colletotrichum tofieldiae]GKT68909.1 C6 zinc finger domain-containing protein [Colletotrichum tofieldiae]
MVVLALGKISQHRGKIPDLLRNIQDNCDLHTTLASANDLPGSRKASISSDGTDFQSTTPLTEKQISNTITPSPPPHMKDADRRSAAKSVRPNYHDVPGLEYFALASDIMGGYFGDVSITHVHALVFASLYLGQLGRVVESHGYICLAARALVMLMRRDLYNYQQLRDAQSGGTPTLISNSEDNTKVMTYWTCLQLERSQPRSSCAAAMLTAPSDILAELPLPPSPILNFEEYMPWPNMDLLKAEFSEEICEAYLGQLHLRKQLNLIHSMLYDPDPSKERFGDALNIAESASAFNHTLSARHANQHRNRLRCSHVQCHTISGRPCLRLYRGVDAGPFRQFQSR